MTQLSSRSFPRVAFEAPLRMQPHKKPTHAVAVQTCNISQGGMFVASKVLYGVGTVIDANLPLDRTTTRLRGRVAWVRPEEHPSRPRGMGIEFVDLSNRSNRLLTRTLEDFPPEQREVSLHFEEAAPIRARAKVVDEGIEVTSRLPFLELESPVKVNIGGDPGDDRTVEGEINAVDLQTTKANRVPQLMIDVALADGTKGNGSHTASGEIELPTTLPSTETPLDETPLDETPLDRAQLDEARAKPSHDEAQPDTEQSLDLFKRVEPTADKSHQAERSRRAPLWIGLAVVVPVLALLASAIFERSPELPGTEPPAAEPAADPPPARAPTPTVVTPAADEQPTARQAARPASEQTRGADQPRADNETPNNDQAVATSAAQPVAVTLTTEHARLVVAIEGSAEGAEVYPLANPQGVAVRLPRGTVRAGLGRHLVRQGPLNNLLVRRVPASAGQRAMLFFRGQRERRHKVTFEPGQIIFEVER